MNSAIGWWTIHAVKLFGYVGFDDERDTNEFETECWECDRTFSFWKLAWSLCEGECYLTRRCPRHRNGGWQTRGLRHGREANCNAKQRAEREARRRCDAALKEKRMAER